MRKSIEILNLQNTASVFGDGLEFFYINIRPNSKTKYIYSLLLQIIGLYDRSVYVIRSTVGY